MRFIEGRLGDLHSLGPHSSEMRQAVPLGEPATHVHVFLRGFHVGHESNRDHNWKTVKISLEAVRTEDPSEAIVISKVLLSDSDPYSEGVPIIASEHVRAVVDYTVVAY